MKRLTLWILSSVVLSGCTTMEQSPVVFDQLTEYRLSGEGRVTAGPYTLDFYCERRPFQSYVGKNSSSIQTPIKLIVTPSLAKNQQLRTAFEPVIAEGYQGEIFQSGSTVSFTPGVFAGPSTLLIDKVPSGTAELTVRGKLIVEEVEEDELTLASAELNFEPIEVGGRESWKFTPGKLTTKRGRAFAIQSNPDMSHKTEVIELQIGFDTSREYSPVELTYSSAGPSMGQSGISGVSFGTGKKVKIIPPAPYEAKSRVFSPFVQKFTVRQVTGEYPFEFKYKIHFESNR